VTNPRTPEQKAADESVLKAVEDGTFPKASEEMREKALDKLKEKQNAESLAFKCPKCGQDGVGPNFVFKAGGCYFQFPCACQLTQEEYAAWVTGGGKA